MKFNVLITAVIGALTTFAVAQVTFDTDVTLKPQFFKNDIEACIILINGAEIAPSTYVPLMKAVQSKSDLKLWVGIPHFNLDTPNPLKMDESVARVLDSLRKDGMTTNNIFMAGHSLGGAVVQTWSASNAANVTGQILMGSFLTHKWKKDYVFDYPVSTLTIGGELDGLARVTRFAEALYTQITSAANPSAAASTFPVTVVKGLSHMQFASGDPPKLVFERDLLPELTLDEAHTLVAADISAFLDVRLQSKSAAASAATLQSRLSETSAFVTPIIDALNLEGYHNFKPPCLCKEDTCAEQDTCTAGCPFTKLVSQKLMAGLDLSPVSGLTVENTDSFHDVWETQPTVHLPTIQNSCSQPAGCVLKTTTITQGVYHTGEDLEIWKKHFDVSWLDTAFFPISAVELRTKMSSRQNIFTHAGVSSPNFDELDGGHVRCGEINQASLDWANAAAAPSTVSRFAQHGQPYKVVADVDVCAAGPCWIWKELQYNTTEDGSAVELASPNFITATDFLIPKSAGFHYCKVLSPARAIEWLYVDGLRAKYSLKSSA